MAELPSMILKETNGLSSWCRRLSFLVCKHIILILVYQLIFAGFQAEDYERFDIPALHPQFDVYGPTKLDDPQATWKIVWTGEEDVREHMPFARLSYTKALGWWDGALKRVVSEKGREMIIGPMPPALPIVEHAGLGLRGHIKKYLGQLRVKHDKVDGGVLLLVQCETGDDDDASRCENIRGPEEPASAHTSEPQKNSAEGQ